MAVGIDSEASMFWAILAAAPRSGVALGATAGTGTGRGEGAGVEGCDPVDNGRAAEMLAGAGINEIHGTGEGAARVAFRTILRFWSCDVLEIEIGDGNRRRSGCG